MELNTSQEEPTNEQYRKIPALVGENSFSIVLPKSFAIALGIGKGEFINVYTENKKMIVEKAYKDKE